MKVKQFVRQFKSDQDEAGHEEAVKALISSFFEEFTRKIDERNIDGYSSRDVWIPLLDEMDNQWHKIAEELPGIKKKGFQDLLFHRHPELKDVWNPKRNS